MSCQVQGPNGISFQCKQCNRRLTQIPDTGMCTNIYIFMAE